MPKKIAQAKRSGKGSLFKHPLFVGIIVALIGLAGILFKRSPATSSTTNENIANSNTVNTFGNNFSQVVGGNLNNQITSNTNSQVMINSPGSLQAGRDIIIHSNSVPKSRVLTVEAAERIKAKLQLAKPVHTVVTTIGQEGDTHQLGQQIVLLLTESGFTNVVPNPSFRLQATYPGVSVLTRPDPEAALIGALSQFFEEIGQKPLFTTTASLIAPDVDLQIIVSRNPTP
jgi:hypothetical protein